MKKSKTRWGWLIVMVIALVGVEIIAANRSMGPSRAPEQVDGISPTAHTSPPPSAASWHYVTNTVVLTGNWSTPAIATVNGQHVSYRIIKGEATEYLARDINRPNAPPDKFSHGVIIHTDKAPIYDWQWRISGLVNTGPIVLEYVVGTFY